MAVKLNRATVRRVLERLAIASPKS
jgi:hypothetical protein